MMNGTHFSLVSRGRSKAVGRLGAVASLAILFGAPADSAARADSPVDRFNASLDRRADVPVEARNLIRKQWSECDQCDAEEFLTQALAVISPRFREGLDAYDADDYARCAAIMRELSADADPFIALNAAAYEVKSLVALERMPEAGERIALLAGRDADIAAHSYFAPEIDFLRGYCLLSDLQYKAAAAAFREFLTRHGEASARLSISAKQILGELTNREEGQLGDVVDLMDYSKRRLRNEDASDAVRTRQQQIIDLLDKLIKEQEEKEKQASSSSSAKSGGSGNPSGGMPGNPMQQSRLPGGNPGGDPNRPARRANPGDAWGSMPPAEREKVLQALREAFPSRYRRLVEQYYEELAKKP